MINHIFIVGQHRTGSTLLKNILDTNSEIAMAFDEMNLFEPFRNNTLDKLIDDTNATIDQLVTFISEQQIYGTFWQEFEKSGITFTELEERLSGAPGLASPLVLREVLKLLADKKGSRISGVKYPLHFSRVEYLIKHFPESKIIFLTRNPLAIIASKLNDSATRKRKKKSAVHRILVHYFTILYFSLEYILSIKTYLKYKKHLKLVTYEDLVRKQREVVMDLCEWCGIAFEGHMLEVSGKASSYNHQSKNGLHTRSLDKYRDVLGTFDTGLISLLTNRYYKRIQHELSANL